jgi:hypothetical protein
VSAPGDSGGARPGLPREFLLCCRSLGVRLTPHVLLVWTGSQCLEWRVAAPGPAARRYRLHRRFRISSSRIGLGQTAGSHRTPMGLHQIAAKVGAGWPVGTAFEARRPVGFSWAGQWPAPIAHRILWLRGLEPGFNQGGDVDSFRRFIYLHGLGDEPTLGRPASRGCIHLAAADLIPLFDRVPLGSLVWISALTRPPSHERQPPAWPGQLAGLRGTGLTLA